jgi:hypothetical protein
MIRLTQHRQRTIAAARFVAWGFFLFLLCPSLGHKTFPRLRAARTHTWGSVQQVLAATCLLAAEKQPLARKPRPLEGLSSQRSTQNHTTQSITHNGDGLSPLFLFQVAFFGCTSSIALFTRAPSYTWAVKAASTRAPQPFPGFSVFQKSRYRPPAWDTSRKCDRRCTENP